MRAHRKQVDEDEAMAIRTREKALSMQRGHGERDSAHSYYADTAVSTSWLYNFGFTNLAVPVYFGVFCIPFRAFQGGLEASSPRLFRFDLKWLLNTRELEFGDLAPCALDLHGRGCRK